ncbi:hypothetical protein HDU67_006950, partial [Dinochytrium kinnereticum]
MDTLLLPLPSPPLSTHDAFDGDDDNIDITEAEGLSAETWLSRHFDATTTTTTSSSPASSRPTSLSSNLHTTFNPSRFLRPTSISHGDDDSIHDGEDQDSDKLAILDALDLYDDAILPSPSHLGPDILALWGGGDEPDARFDTLSSTRSQPFAVRKSISLDFDADDRSSMRGRTRVSRRMQGRQQPWQRSEKRNLKAKSSLSSFGNESDGVDGGV